MPRSRSPLRLALAFALVVCGGASAHAALVAGDNPRNLSFGGLARQYRVYVPVA